MKHPNILIVQSKRIVEENINLIQPIRTGNINSYEKLNDQRQNIIRNILLKGIQNDKIAEKVFKSEIFREKVVCSITLEIYSRKAGTFYKSYQVQGMLPDEVLQSRLFGLKGIHDVKLIEIYEKMKEALGTNKLIPLQDTTGDNTDLYVMEVNVSFDIA